MTKVHRVIVIFILFLLALLYMCLGNQYETAITIPDTPATRAVTTALEDAIAVLDKPFEELDLAELSNVLINDPNYATLVSPDELSELRDYTRKVQGEAALSNFGYLTVMQTKRMNQQNGARLLREARAKAKAVNRTVTLDEMRQLTAQNFGMEPYIPDEREQAVAQPFKRQLTYLSVKVENDRAKVIFNDMVTVRKAILLRINGRWYVADIS